MIPDLVRGTIETLLVPIEDDLENFNTLAGSNPTFDVKTRQGTNMITAQTVTFDGGEPLKARCLVNTNLPILWPAGKYFLYITFNDIIDIPVLGPLEFHVNP